MTEHAIKVCHCDQHEQPHIHVVGADGSHWICTAP